MCVFSEVVVLQVQPQPGGAPSTSGRPRGEAIFIITPDITALQSDGGQSAAAAWAGGGCAGPTAPRCQTLRKAVAVPGPGAKVTSCATLGWAHTFSLSVPQEAHLRPPPRTGDQGVPGKEPGAWPGHLAFPQQHCHSPRATGEVSRRACAGHSWKRMTLVMSREITGGLCGQ